MKRKLRKLFHCAFTIALPLSLNLTSAAWAQPSQWRSFSTADGLGDVEVYTIFESATQGLWFGTRHGATRFDGLWKNFTQSHGLSNDRVFAIAEDDAMNLWFGTAKGVSRYAEGKFYDGPAALAADTVWVIAKDQHGKLWFGTNSHGVYCYAPNDFVNPARHYTMSDGLAGNSVKAIWFDKTGDLWFGTSETGVSRLDTSGAWTTFNNANTNGQLASDRITDIFGDLEGRLWVATIGGGVSRFENNIWSKGPAQIFKNVFALTQDWDRNLWFATEQYVYRYDGVSQVDAFTPNEGLIHETVLNVLQDGYGNMWFATRYAGVSRYDGSWRSFLAGQKVKALAKDHAGDLWFGLDSRGVYRYDQQQKKLESIDCLGLNNRRVQALEVDAEGTVWIGTFGGGVVSVNARGCTSYMAPSPLPENNVFAILEDREENLWFGTFQKGVVRYNRKKAEWKTFNTDSGLVHNQVQAIHQDRSGDLWFGTLAGLSRFNGREWQNFKSASMNSAGYYNILCAGEDSAGSLWFGTNGAGLLKYENGALSWITTEEGLVNNTIHAILYDDSKKRFWFGTEHGVSRWSIANGQWRVFTPGASGLAHEIVKSILLDQILKYDARTGRTDTTLNFWFGTLDGVSRYIGESIPPETFILPPKPELFSIASPAFIVNGRDNVSLPNELSYSYELWQLRQDGSKERVMEQGQISNSNTLAIQTALPNGEFELAVQALDTDKNLDPTPARHRFKTDITPPVVAISAPRPEAYVAGDVAILGVIADEDLEPSAIQFEYRNEDSNEWRHDRLTRFWNASSESQTDTLALWHSGALPNGAYRLRLQARDKLSHASSTEIIVHVDSLFAIADLGERGGIMQSRLPAVEIYLPPGALDKPYRLMINSLLARDRRQAFGKKAIAGFKISVTGEDETPRLQEEKLGTITIRHPGIVQTKEAQRHLVLLQVPANGAYGQARLGGTPDYEQHRITAPFYAFGDFFVIDSLAQGPGALGPELTTLRCRPRIFSTNGGSPNHTDVLFPAREGGVVTMRVYNAAGRLVRELRTEALPAGEHALAWDGRNENHEPCVSGLYIIGVKTTGREMFETVVIVNK